MGKILKKAMFFLMGMIIALNLLCSDTWLGAWSGGMIKVNAAMDRSVFDGKLTEIAGRFPAGSKYDDNLYGNSIRGLRAWECQGYAHWAANYVFGGTVWAANDSFNWTKVYSIANVKAGDIVQYGDPLDGIGHTIFVTAVDGDTIIFTDANSDRKNTIRWGGTIGKNDSFGGRSFKYLKSSPGVNEIPPAPTQGSPMSDVAGAEPTIASGDYHIVTALEGTSGTPGLKCLNTRGLPGTLNQAEAHMELWESYGDSNCVFTVTWLGNGFYKIKVKNSNNMCLDVPNASLNKGEKIWQHADNGTVAQQWQISQSSDGTGYKIRSKCNGWFLDVTNESTANGTDIQLWSENGSNAQKWYFIPWGGGSQAQQQIADGEYQIVSKSAQDKVMSAEGNGVTNGTNIVLGSNKGDAGHTFNVKWIGNGYYEIINKKSNLELTVDAAMSKSGTNVHLWEKAGVYNQGWLFKSCGDGYYNIISKCNGLYLDAGGTNSNVLMWVGHGLDHQKWKFVPYVRNVESVTLDRTNITLKVGEQYTLWTTISPTDATNKTLTWESSNPSVAAIGLYQAVQSNVVTAKAPGTATITVKSANGKTATCQVTVQETHTHVYGSVWKSDGSSHWKECTCGARAEEAAHEFVQKSDESKHWKECLCGAKSEEAAHGFTQNSDATNHWKECSCGARTGEAEHTFAWIVDTAATAESTGLKHEECRICGSKRNEGTVIDKIPVEHTHEYGNGWQSDGENHWKACVCGDKSENAVHEFEWIIDREATQENTGLKHEQCNTCGYRRSGGTVIEKLPTPEHTHTYGSGWQSDGNNHWKMCACGEKSEESAHTFTWVVDQVATTESTGLEHEECGICDYSRNVGTVIEKLPASHTHVYGNDWKSDGENHWKECECGVRTEEAEHMFAWIVDTAATQTAEGIKHEECKTCGYKRCDMLWTVDVNISCKCSVSAGMSICKNTTYAAGSFVVNDNLQMLL